MKFFIILFLFSLFSSPAFSMEDEVVFELKRFSKKKQTQTKRKRKKTIPGQDLNEHLFPTIKNF